LLPADGVTESHPDNGAQKEEKEEKRQSREDVSDQVALFRFLF
jgi:hypothetical protein